MGVRMLFKRTTNVLTTFHIVFHHLTSPSLINFPRRGQEKERYIKATSFSTCIVHWRGCE